MGVDFAGASELLPAMVGGPAAARHAPEVGDEGEWRPPPAPLSIKLGGGLGSH